MMDRRYWVWSAVSGFIALSWEIVWARVFNFVSGSQASVFGYMLAAYLAGLALGALLSRRWFTAAAALPSMIRWASVVAFVVAPLTAWLACQGLWHWGYALVSAAGAVLGLVFPLLCHEAIANDDQAGAQLSQLYFANIIGSGTGSLLTGFWLMDLLTLWQLSTVLLLAGFYWAWQVGGKLQRPGLLQLVLIAAAAWPMVHLWERLQYKTEFTAGMRFPITVESKHGVITVDSSHRIYGNGAYDGMIETGLHAGSWMVRPYFLSAVQPRMERVLVIGVASGSWTQILVQHPQVKSIVAVELSQGYLDVIRQTPAVSSILTDPKVELVIDDGRRWLRRHPEAKFDAIVMNTTHHWREFASALLSVEFLTEVKQHLAPGGVAFWNCTESARAIRTGMEVFPHTLMVMNHCLASNDPMQIDAKHWETILRSYSIQGQPLFDPSSGEAELAAVLGFVQKKKVFSEADKWTWMDRSMMQQEFGKAELITDDNLGDEY
jgi:spermidine synthase